MGILLGTTTTDPMKAAQEGEVGLVRIDHLESTIAASTLANLIKVGIISLLSLTEGDMTPGV